MATIGYKRVSTVTQNEDRQDFADYEVDKVFSDKASGRDKDRPALKECLNYLREGDTLIVHSLDRLARSLLDLNAIVSEQTSKGVTVIFIKEGLTFTKDSDNPTADLMLNILGAIAQFERSLIRERQAEGIAKAKAKGVYKGRKPSLTLKQCEEIKSKQSQGVPIARLAKDYGVSRPTIYKALDGKLEAEIKAYEQKG
jgi:DNA invertase Pin-like site-specific DNA recombinase